MITLVSSAMINGEIEFNEGFTQGLKDTWRRFGQTYLKREIKFDTDQDVLNFVKDYNRTIKRPNKLNSAMLKLVEQGVKGKLIEDIDVTKGPKVGDTAFSKRASDNVQQLYETKGVNF